MTDAFLEVIGLTDRQRKAAASQGVDLVVTAGAGSGKTRTLTARYLAMLAAGFAPHEVVAITFTRKAAREMRNRIRQALHDLRDAAQDLEARRGWTELEAQMDAARIGTIHSLCAEILRAHPAEAGVDPQFEELGEGLIPVVRNHAVEQALAWVVEQPSMAPLFASLSIGMLQKLLAFLLDNRLEAVPLLQQAGSAERKMAGFLLQKLEGEAGNPDLTRPLDDLRAMAGAGDIDEIAGGKMALQIKHLLACWGEAQRALRSGDPVAVAQSLYTLRRQHTRLNVGRRTSPAKDAVREFREAYDALLDPWLGGARSGDPPPNPQVEARFVEILPLLERLFKQALQRYRLALDERRALDFDDLEGKALELLTIPAIRARWRDALAAVLIDEFQDTNRRQQAIIEALCEDVPGKLFVVGDARQSIYRFRGADVVGFVETQSRVRREGGHLIELDLTFRSHPALLGALADLLGPVMGTIHDPDHPHLVPFKPLKPYRERPRDGVKSPYIEFLIGRGEDAAEGRRIAAHTLARRLMVLHQGGQIQRWDDVALLFRASSGFPHYEDALVLHGIPFVTVAGAGFYDRPEIRDVLNMLRALSDPWDDLALAGLLRSPAFGLSDGALMQLRFQDRTPRPLREALDGDLSYLHNPDRARARRAWEAVQEIRPLVDRLPVGELLKLLIDRTDYRAVLASTGEPRLWRNLDKLLEDAYASGLIRVRAFLEYLHTLREVGAREGEAPPDAEGSLQLMTIHKSKGLEFPFVVLADAGYSFPYISSPAYLSQGAVFAFEIDRLEGRPLAYQLAKWEDREQEEAERQRLLYVALTRAREKVLVSGHLSQGSSKSWLGTLLEVAGAAGLLDELEKAPQEHRVIPLPGGGDVWVELAVEARVPSAGIEIPPEEDAPSVHQRPLYKPLVEPSIGMERDHEREEGAHRLWHPADPDRELAIVVGKMLHRALQHWRFPGEQGFEGRLEAVALQEGLLDSSQRERAVRQVIQLLSRLKAHPIWRELDGALERYHEVPYTYQPPGGGDPDDGVIDLLYRTESGWHMVDFKTDEIRSQGMLAEKIAQHTPQMRRYAHAAAALLGVQPLAWLCYLDAQDGVILHEI